MVTSFQATSSNMTLTYEYRYYILPVIISSTAIVLVVTEGTTSGYDFQYHFRL